MRFETAVTSLARYSAGYVDILIEISTSVRFIIEAKRLSRPLSDKDRDQALNYGRSIKNACFAVVTNGSEVRVFNVATGLPLLWNGRRADKIPMKSDLPGIIKRMKADPLLADIGVTDKSLPFRPGLPLRQLNALFQRCHNIIRKIEKDEEHAFAGFSKLLFLKLLEEKADSDPHFRLGHSYQFHTLAEYPVENADQVQTAVAAMLHAVATKTPYGDVLSTPIYMTKDKTYWSIVKELACVCFSDSNLDSKGAAFEYFVRATLKGKSLGQYFTPRPVVQMMSALVGREKIVDELMIRGIDKGLKVFDPACGTGGFLVFLLEQGLRNIRKKVEDRKLSVAAAEALAKRLTEHTFFGSDANRGVVGAAKMNMIIAGDGHSNIQPEDSLLVSATNWSTSNPDCHFIFSNPPFGTSESSTLSTDDRLQFKIRSSKGQLLFLQKMVLATCPGGEICTVIDEGVLNTDQARDIRAWVLKHCRLRAVVRLPNETFKPNKINVKSSVLLLEKLLEADENGDLQYDVSFIDLASLGYEGSGDSMRGFNMERLLSEVEAEWLKAKNGKKASGYHWSGFNVPVSELRSDSEVRFDLKYWEPDLRARIAIIQATGGKTIAELNQIQTRRGKSPDADCYVDQVDGYALVVKSGSSMSKFGELLAEGDWIEKNIYEEFADRAATEGVNINLVRKGDVLVSSTGDGSLGKTCVYNLPNPEIADGHVSIIRPLPSLVAPAYLADFLRSGIGAQQIERLYTGSTGQIELSAELLDRVVVDLLSGVPEQKITSRALRSAERKFRNQVEKAESSLAVAQDAFVGRLHNHKQ